MVQFVHEVHPVFAVVLTTFAHMLCGSNDDTMPSFNLFRVQVVVLSNFNLEHEVRKCLKFENVALFLLLLRGKPRTWWHGGSDAANLKHSTTQHRKPRTFYCKT